MRIVEPTVTWNRCDHLPDRHYPTAHLTQERHDAVPFPFSALRSLTARLIPYSSQSGNQPKDYERIKCVSSKIGLFVYRNLS